jgi:hypothetical protein
MAMGRDFNIGTKKDGMGLPGHRIQFGDVAYYDFLLGAGLTPAKSKTIGALIIPDQFYADFLRGLYDGDGSSYGYMDPRWRSSFMFYTSFSSASPLFIKYLQQANTRLMKVSPGAIKKPKGALSLTYAKADSHKIYQFMYYAGHGPFLKRKKDKLAAFVERDKIDIIT